MAFRWKGQREDERVVFFFSFVFTRVLSRVPSSLLASCTVIARVLNTSVSWYIFICLYISILDFYCSVHRAFPAQKIGSKKDIGVKKKNYILFNVFIQTFLRRVYYNPCFISFLPVFVLCSSKKHKKKNDSTRVHNIAYVHTIMNNLVYIQQEHHHQGNLLTTIDFLFLFLCLLCSGFWGGGGGAALTGEVTVKTNEVAAAGAEVESLNYTVERMARELAAKVIFAATIYIV